MSWRCPVRGYERARGRRRALEGRDVALRDHPVDHGQRRRHRFWPLSPWLCRGLLEPLAEVPRGGIEPPTRGFSVRARIWPSPRETRALSASDRSALDADDVRVGEARHGAGLAPQPRAHVVALARRLATSHLDANRVLHLVHVALAERQALGFVRLANCVGVGRLG